MKYSGGEWRQNVGNKAKGRITKWVFQETKARQIFRKTKMIVKKHKNSSFFIFNMDCNNMDYYFN